jgi:hypothetical protein
MPAGRQIVLIMTSTGVLRAELQRLPDQTLRYCFAMSDDNGACLAGGMPRWGQMVIGVAMGVSPADVPGTGGVPHLPGPVEVTTW